jgi:hypothetical protein
LDQHASLGAEDLHRKVVLGIIEAQPKPNVGEFLLDTVVDRAGATPKILRFLFQCGPHTRSLEKESILRSLNKDSQHRATSCHLPASQSFDGKCYSQVVHIMGSFRHAFLGRSTGLSIQGNWPMVWAGNQQSKAAGERAKNDKEGKMHPIFKISGKISPYFRKRRMEQFLRTFAPGKATRILDVGGLPRAWQGVDVKSEITILNIEPLDAFEGSFLQPNHIAMVGDGTRLPFAGKSFDVVYSNSVIEHLGTWERQQAFAAEARRVGKGYWIQTPGKEFPIEPHYFGPFVHWFPKRVQKQLLRNCTLWGLLGRPTEAILDEVLAELRLLRFAEFRRLFDGAQFFIERLIGIPKSYTAFQIAR